MNFLHSEKKITFPEETAMEFQHKGKDILKGEKNKEEKKKKCFAFTLLYYRFACASKNIIFPTHSTESQEKVRYLSLGGETKTMKA